MRVPRPGRRATGSKAIADLFPLRLADHGGCEDWVVDTEAAVAAEVAAVTGTSVAMGHSNLRYARALRERLPMVAAAFRADYLDFPMVRALIYRTELITDPDLLARVDAPLAATAPGWMGQTPWRLTAAIDRLVATLDPMRCGRPARTPPTAGDEDGALAWRQVCCSGSPQEPLGKAMVGVLHGGHRIVRAGRKSRS